MVERREKSGSAAEFYIDDGYTVLYNEGVLGHYMNCVPLPALLTSHFSLSPEVNKSLYQLPVIHPLQTPKCGQPAGYPV